MNFYFTDVVLVALPLALHAKRCANRSAFTVNAGIGAANRANLVRYGHHTCSTSYDETLDSF